VTDHFLHYNAELVQLEQESHWTKTSHFVDDPIYRLHLTIPRYLPPVFIFPVVSLPASVLHFVHISPYYLSHGYCVLWSCMVFSDRSL
ncbi:hypothetical protein AZE42_12784, partial [Rhizopogon vesiculosus]